MLSPKLLLTYVAPGDVTCRCYGGRAKSQVQVVKSDIDGTDWPGRSGAGHEKMREIQIDSAISGTATNLHRSNKEIAQYELKDDDLRAPRLLKW